VSFDVQALFIYFEHMKPILIFDWDGTIVDSNGFKWGELWNMTFDDDDEKQRIVLDYLQTEEGRGLNRYQLIQKVLSDTGEESVRGLDKEELLVNPKILEYSNKFSEIMDNSISLIEPFEGVRKVLKDLKENGYKMYVVTAGGTLNVRKQVEHLGLSNIFVKVLGNPESKSENFEEISTKETGNYVVIGDGESDVRLAEYIGCKFIGIVNNWNGWSLGENNIKSLTLIKNLL
jgi:phosphoglycolate phosphatase-like HAD superfamily hydrolase